MLGIPIFNILIIFCSFLGIFIGYQAARVIYKKKLELLTSKPAQNAQAFPAPEKVLGKESIVEDKIWYESALEFIFKFNEALSLNLERSKVIQFLTEGARNFLYVEHSVLLLWDKNAQGLVVTGASGLPGDLTHYPVLKDEESISMFVARQRQILIVNDLEQEAYLRKINKEDYLRKSFISVPLVFQNNLLGVLHVCDKKFVNPFTKRDELLIANISRIGAIALQNANLYEQIQQDYLKTITALAAATDARDNYTMHHSENVAKYAVEIAKKLQCKHYEIDLVRQAALLHDIGKIGIKDAILLKGEKLTQEEFEYIKLHPIKGEEIVKILSFLKRAASLIRHHHERYDGSGYPDGLKGEDIELGARILAVADVYDAITSDRPYRSASSVQEAIDELERNKGTQFDPEIVECLRKIITENPSSVR